MVSNAVHVGSVNKQWRGSGYDLTEQLKTNQNASGRGYSSVGTESDRHAVDAGSIPLCSTGIFFQESTFNADSYGLRTPSCAIACINIWAHVNDPVFHVRSSVDYGNTKTPSMHRRLGRVTLPQLAFPGESDPDFPRQNSHWDQYSCNK